MTLPDEINEPIADPLTAEPPSAERPSETPLATRLFFGALVVAALLALFWPRGEDTFVRPGGFLIDATGRPVPVIGELAPVTLLHFWATWCPPCLGEIPMLKALEDDLADRAGFAVVYVAVADDPRQVESFLGDEEAQRMLYDSEWKVANRHGTEKLPETYLIVNGEVQEKFIGAANWSDPAIRARVEAAIASVGEASPGAEG